MATVVKDVFASYKLEDIPVYMLRVEIRVHGKRYSGTDDPVFIEIGNSTKKYYLNKGKNDFKTSSYNYYSLKPENISKVKDITRLKVGKSGHDQLRIRWIKLYVNGATNWVFKKDFGESEGKAIDDGESINILNAFIRDYIKTRGIDCRGHLPRFLVDDVKKEVRFFDALVVNERIFEELIETYVGDEIHDDKLYWGGLDGSKWVHSFHQSGDARSTIHTTIDLKYDVDYLPDPEIDVAFDLNFQGNISCDVRNVSIKGDIVLDVYQFLSSKVSKTISRAKARIEGFDFYIPVAALPGYGSSWKFIPTPPTFYISDGGTVKFSWN